MLDAIKDLGLKTDDPTWPNGEVLGEALYAGKVTAPVYFPSPPSHGYYRNMRGIKLAQKEGVKFIGSGLAKHNNKAAFYATARGTASTRWIHDGPDGDETPMLTIDGIGLVIDGINMWRYVDPIYDRPQGCGIVLSKVGPPTGCIDIPRVALAGFNVAIDIPSSDNCDGTRFGYVLSEYNKTLLRCNNLQTTCLSFGHIRVYDLPGKNADGWVWDVAQGGSIGANLLELIGPRGVLRSGGPGDSTFWIDNLKVDNGAAGWSLCEAWGPLNFRVRGEIGRQAAPKRPPIMLHNPGTPSFTPPANYQCLDVALWGHNPTGINNMLWRPTASEYRVR